MARPKRTTEEKIEEEIVIPQSQVEPIARLEQFDPSLPESKQRHLR